MEYARYVAKICYEIQIIRVHDVYVVCQLLRDAAFSVRSLVPHVRKALWSIWEGLSNVPRLHYVIVGMWIGGAMGSCLWGMFSTYFMMTLFVLLFTNLGERKAGEVSAYSVFNEGYQVLPGTLQWAEMEAELRGHRDLGRERDHHIVEDSDVDIDAYSSSGLEDDSDDSKEGGGEGTRDGPPPLEGITAAGHSNTTTTSGDGASDWVRGVMIRQKYLLQRARQKIAKEKETTGG